jgi:ribosomal protein S18 acetylase RimI-like enzyme
MKIQHSQTEHLAEYAQHLKSLNDEDRYTRFGYAVSQAAIDSMILNMLYHQDQHHLFTYYLDDHIVGFGHLAREDADWELAVSVEHQYQGRGIANELMEHMIAWGKVHGVHSVFMHCISDNQRIQHLARKHGLKTMERSGHELTAQVKLPDPTVLDYTASFINEQRALVEDITKLQQAWVKNWIAPKHDHSN